MLRHVLFYLLRTRDEKTASHRQTTLMTLLPQLPDGAITRDRLLSLAEMAEFYTVCELIYSERRDWKNVIKSRLNNKQERQEVFSLIDQLLADKSLTQREQMVISLIMFFL